MEVLRHAVWWQDPLVRLLFMLWDRPRGDEIDNEALELTKQMFDHQGDTRLNEQSDRFCKQNTDFQSHSVWCETRDQYACVMGDISQRRNLHNLGARSRRFVCEIAICFTALASFLPHDLRVEWSSILSPYRMWSSPTPENERVGCVAWQWLLHFHGEGLYTNVRPSWGLLARRQPSFSCQADLVVKCFRLRRLLYYEKEGKTSMSSNITCRPRFVFQVT